MLDEDSRAMKPVLEGHTVTSEVRRGRKPCRGTEQALLQGMSRLSFPTPSAAVPHPSYPSAQAAAGLGYMI